MPLTLGVTGSIAAGKSLVCTHLATTYGAIHIDADREVHQLYAPGMPGFGRVVAEFGEDIVGADGVIDRKVLGAKVFGNAERMEALRTAIGDIPAHFMGVLRHWREELPADAVAVLEAVNLLERNYMTLADAAWLIVCDRGTAVSRMVAKRGLTEAEAEQRLASATDWREREPAADRVFHNDGPVEDLLAEVDAAIGELQTAHAAGTLAKPRWYAARGRSE
jgi:dephospho-CoA kinase